MSQFPIPHNRGDYPYEEEYVPPSSLHTEDRPYISPSLGEFLSSLNIEKYPIPYPDRDNTTIDNPEGNISSEDLSNSIPPEGLEVMDLIKKLSQIYGTRI